MYSKYTCNHRLQL